MIDCSLDTTVVIDLMRRKETAREIVKPFTNPGISHVVFGELLLGLHKSGRPDETLKVVNALRGMRILVADDTTAAIYAEVRYELEKLGNPIPQNDIWIAAITLQAQVPLITRDEHFRRIPQLDLLVY